MATTGGGEWRVPRRWPWWRTEEGTDWALLLGLVLGGAAVLVLVAGTIVVAVQPRGLRSAPRTGGPELPRPEEGWTLSPRDPITAVPDAGGHTSAAELVVVQVRPNVASGSPSRTEARLVRFSLEAGDRSAGGGAGDPGGSGGWRRRWVVELGEAGETVATAASGRVVAVASRFDLTLLDPDDGAALGQWPVVVACDTCLAVVGETAVVVDGDGWISGYRAGSPDAVWRSEARAALPRSVRAVGGLVVVNLRRAPDAANLMATGVLDPEDGRIVSRLPDPCRPVTVPDLPRTLLGVAPIGSSTSVVAVVGSQSGPVSTPCVARFDLATGEVAWSRPGPPSPAGWAPEVEVLAPPGHVTVLGTFGQDPTRSGWALDLDPATGAATTLAVPAGEHLAGLVAAEPTVVAVARPTAPEAASQLVGWDRSDVAARFDVPLGAPVMPGLEPAVDQPGATTGTPIAVAVLDGTTWVFDTADGEVSARPFDPEAGRLGAVVGTQPVPGAIAGEDRSALLIGRADGFAVLKLGGELVAVQPSSDDLAVFVAE